MIEKLIAEEEFLWEFEMNKKREKIKLFLVI